MPGRSIGTTQLGTLTSLRAVPAVIAVLAVINIGTALWIAVDARSFFDNVGPFGAYNAHYLGDVAAFQAGIGLGLAASLIWPALRPGALVTAALFTGIHALNHWLDVNEAHAGSDAGIVDAVSLTLLTVVIAPFAVAAARGRR